MIFSKFDIKQLYGDQNISIPIEDNRLILVAKNGASKTTILKMIFLFLTKQWEKLSNYEFHSVTATIDGNEYKFDRQAYQFSQSPQYKIVELSKEFPLYSGFISETLASWNSSEILEISNHVEIAAERYDIPPGLLAKLLNTLIVSKGNDLNFTWDHYLLYLPTFRRIEEEFNIIFSDFNTLLNNYIRELQPQLEEFDSDTDGDVDIEINGVLKNSPFVHNSIFYNLWQSRDLERWLNKKENLYLELAEFGMEDIAYKVKSILEEKENKLTLERLSQYINVCNKYLSPEKSLQLKDNLLFVVGKSHSMELNKLSSGEKQIVALFFHLYLEDNKPFVIIDEPEISLSLRWQKDIINDIIDAEVSGLIVATHSPFVISEAIKPFSHSVNEFYV